MIRLSYFTMSAHALERAGIVIRLVIQTDRAGAFVDHYFECGSPIPDSLHLASSLWSVNPEALIDHIPHRFQFMATLDVLQFVRSGLQAAVDGILMPDDIEIIDDDDVEQRRSPACEIPKGGDWAQQQPGLSQ